LGDIGKIREHYDFSFDGRKLGLILFSVFAAASLIFVLGLSVGIQWEKKRSAKDATQPPPSAKAAISPPESHAEAVVPAAVALPVAPPVAAQPVKSETAQDPVTVANPGTITVDKGPRAAPTRPQQDAKTAEKPGKANKERTVDNLTFPKVLTSNVKDAAPLKTAKPEKADIQKPAASGGTYTIQVGAYKEKKEADTRAERLKRKGYDARVVSGKDKDGAVLYKIRVGNFGTQGEAQPTARKIESSEQVTTYITPDR